MELAGLKHKKIFYEIDRMAVDIEVLKEIKNGKMVRSTAS